MDSRSVAFPMRMMKQLHSWIIDKMSENDLEDLLKRLLDKTETGLSWSNSWWMMIMIMNALNTLSIQMGEDDLEDR
jgi:hypothetical protein